MVRGGFSAYGASMPAARVAASPAQLRAAASRSAGERWLVAVLASSVAVAMLVLSGMAVRSSMAENRSKAQIGSTFGRAALRQEEYRARNDRFADWSELANEGMRLPAELRVLSSNATRSHWYLRVRDRNTGVVCDRVGQLLENPNRAPLRCE